MNNPDSLFARLYKTVVIGPSIFSRIFYFILGAPMSYGIKTGIFFLLTRHLGYSERIAYFVSLSVITVFFSLWNYFVNFRSARNYAESLPRYIAALGFCAATDYLLAQTGFKHLSKTAFAQQAAHSHWMWLLQAAIIMASTCTVSVLKFLLYNYWVYPHAPTPKAAESVEARQN